jgi:cation transport ATPase
MKNRFFVFFLMIAIVAVIVLGIVVFLLFWDSSRYPDPGKIRVIGSFGMENDLCSAPVFDANTGFGANTGFAVNPYQTGNPERDIAVIIGASVSYILREVKYFTLFIVVLTVFALNACSIIIYFILDKAVQPIVKREETQKNEEYAAITTDPAAVLKIGLRARPFCHSKLTKCPPK